jgi:O-antigen ligase
MTKAVFSTAVGYPASRQPGIDSSLMGTGLPLVLGFMLLAVIAGAVVALTEANALYLTLAVIGCLFILFDFRIGVVLLVLLLPISRSAIFPHAMMGITGLNPLNVLLVATLGSYLLHSLTDGSLRRFLPAPLLWLYIVPIVLAGIVASRHIGEIAPYLLMSDGIDLPGRWVQPPDTATGHLLERLFKPLMLVGFGLLVAAAVARSARPEKFLVPIIVSIWIMCALVIVYVVISGASLGELARSESRTFLTPLGMHANELGRLYTFAFALLLFTWAERKEQGLKMWLLASMGIVVVALLLTFSRSAFAGLLVVSGLFVLWRLNAKTLIVAAVVTAIALFALPDALYDRATTGFGEGMNAITAGRIEGLWLPLLPDVMRNPLFGNGIGSILWSGAMRTGAGTTIIATTHPHNAYLEALLDMGFVGLAVLCAYFIHVLNRFWRLGKEPAISDTMRGFYQGAAAGLVSMLVMAVVDSSLVPKAEHAFLWLAIGMMYGQVRSQTAHRA